MPIASSKSSNSVLIMEGNDISKSGLLLVEKKVRNLEKRKMKLDAYKKKLDDGVKLNDDQMGAINNLAVVEMNLEMAKELHKQFQQLHAEHQKQMKKQARREQVASQTAQYNNDIAKVGEVLELQSLMDNLSEDVRTDFLNGTNGAALVTEEEFGQIDKFYKLITPDAEAEEKMPKQIKDASEHIVNFFNSTPAAVADTTYKALHEVVSRIKKCGYFDPDKTSTEEGGNEEEEEGSSRASTPNGELSAGSSEEAQENAVQQPQEEETEPAPAVVPSDIQKEQEPIPPQDIQQEVAPPPVADVTAFTANEHGLNFLGDSEIEKAASQPENSAPVAQGVSDWAEEVENGQHAGEPDTGNNDAQPTTNGFGHRGRGGGRGGGYRGNFNNRRGGGGDRGGPRRGGRGGFGQYRGGGGGGGFGQDHDGFRRGGRGGRGGFGRGGRARGARREGPPPQ